MQPAGQSAPVSSLLSSSKQRRKRTPRPDHFVALRLSCPAVTSAFAAVHSALLRDDASVGENLTRATEAHVTLAVLRLPPGEAALAAVSRALDEASGHETFAALPQFLSLVGLASFDTRVAFLRFDGASVAPLTAVAAAVKDALLRNGCDVDVRGDTYPHVTVAKVRGNGRSNRQPRQLELASALSLGDAASAMKVPHGHRLLLCSMLAPRAADGFYAVVAEGKG